jgi:hypothetical protein
MLAKTSFNNSATVITEYVDPVVYGWNTKLASEKI